MNYDVKISGARIRTHDLWIRKRVCNLHYSIPKSETGERRAKSGLRVIREDQIERYEEI